MIEGSLATSPSPTPPGMRVRTTAVRQLKHGSALRCREQLPTSTCGSRGRAGYFDFSQGRELESGFCDGTAMSPRRSAHPVLEPGDGFGSDSTQKPSPPFGVKRRSMKRVTLSIIRWPPFHWTGQGRKPRKRERASARLDAADRRRRHFYRQINP
jgi:hypothetical protein